jgi:hypothetical protein
MNTTQIILLLLAKWGPTLAEAAVKLAKVENPTDQQWAELFAMAEKPYDDYVKPK